MRLTFWPFIVGILISASCAQEVGFIDLSAIRQPTRAGLPSSSIIEDIACSDSKLVLPHRVKASLEWMSTTEVHARQLLRIEVRVQNIGTAPITVPKGATLTDIEPKDTTTRFEYWTLLLPLLAGVPSRGIMLGWLETYGSADRPETLLTLMPGAWIRVKGDIAVRRWYTGDVNVTASTDFWLRRYLYPGEDAKRIIPSNEDCIQQLGGVTIQARLHGPH
jgi:hypothetical protein